uniref:Vesicle transport protein GOT1B n=1 Tax=Timema tahoe TaxID=61484 RepID=A0A7R9FIV1_9NEOP|nr:unnamed protein product [Timema tahoe]
MAHGTALLRISCVIGHMYLFSLAIRDLLSWGSFTKILFIAGLACVIGLERTFRFFFQTHKAKATCCFFGGIIVVLFGWPLVGMVFETYGFFLLFSGFFPAAINFLRRVPLLGTVLNLPGIRMVIDRLAGDSSRTTV